MVRYGLVVVHVVSPLYNTYLPLPSSEMPGCLGNEAYKGFLPRVAVPAMVGKAFYAPTNHSRGNVEVSCTLNLNQPAVEAFLDFHHKKYLDSVSEKVKEIIDTGKGEVQLTIIEVRTQLIRGF